MPVDALLAVAQLLQEPASDWAQDQKSEAILLADGLSAAILKTRMKLMYRFLGSERKAVVNATFSVLIALVKLGPRSASDLWDAFEFGLPALCKAAEPSRYGSSWNQSTAKVPQICLLNSDACHVSEKLSLRALIA